MRRMTHANTGAPLPHHPSLHDRLDGLKHALSDAVKTHAARCSVCHTELQVADVAQGFCSDTDACTCRAFSVRCW